MCSSSLHRRSHSPWIYIGGRRFSRSIRTAPFGIAIFSPCLPRTSNLNLPGDGAALCKLHCQSFLLERPRRPRVLLIKADRRFSYCSLKVRSQRPYGCGSVANGIACCAEWTGSLEEAPEAHSGVADKLEIPGRCPLHHPINLGPAWPGWPIAVINHFAMSPRRIPRGHQMTPSIGPFHTGEGGGGKYWVTKAWHDGHARAHTRRQDRATLALSGI